jgi:hypothetical protein
VGDDVEVVVVEDPVCIATAETQPRGQGVNRACLSGRDLCGYDYISASKDGIMSVNMNPTSMTRLDDMGAK